MEAWYIWVDNRTDSKPEIIEWNMSSVGLHWHGARRVVGVWCYQVFDLAFIMQILGY